MVFLLKYDSISLEVDGIPLDTGDYLGFYYLDNGREVFIAEKELLFDVEIDTVRLYGYDTIREGVRSGEAIYIKAWDKNQNCEISTVDTIITAPEWEGRFDPFSNTAYTIQEVTFSRASIRYPVSSAADTSTEVISPLSSGDFNARYLAGAGLAINTATGAVIPNESDTGNYVITVNTNECLANTRFDFTIIHIAEDPDTTSPQDTISPLDPLIPLQNGFTRQKILAPGSSDRDYQSVYFEGNQLVRVYDKSGQVVRTIQAPARWTGDDNQGRDLPTDEYYIRIGKEPLYPLTLIRRY